LEQYETDRAQTARIMYDESRRLRDLQDERIRDLQQRSITVLTLVSAAVTIVAGVSSAARVERGALTVALVAVVGMVFSGVVVHIPKGGYREGPNVDDLHDIQYSSAHPGYQVLRDVGLYHFEHYRKNNDGVLKWINIGFACELVFAAVAVVSILSGAAA
jgi:hypothetical protein